jgi:hypothetical protein
LLIDAVGVSRPVKSGDVLVVPAAHIPVPDHEADGRARGLPLENAREDLDQVLLLPGAGEGLAGPPSLEVPLNVFLPEGNARGAAVDDGPESGPVGFPPCGDSEEPTENASRHVIVLPRERNLKPAEGEAVNFMALRADSPFAGPVDRLQQSPLLDTRLEKVILDN